MTISDIFNPPQESEYVLAQDTLRTAVSKMTSHGYSQLIVVKRGGKGNIKKPYVLGCISWNSIGSILRNKDIDMNAPVKDFLEPIEDSSKFLLVNISEMVTDVAKKLMDREYVVAYDDSDSIRGFITAYDIAKLYLDMVMPYTDIQKIEISLRKILKRLPIEDVREASKTSGHDRSFDKIEEMEFSEYETVFRKKWDELGLRNDMEEFLESLRTIRQIRNKIMHFNAEKISPEDQELLTAFGRKLEKLIKNGYH